MDVKSKTFDLAERYKVRKKRKQSVSENLIRMGPILEIVRAAIWTGKVSGEKPVSIMLIAEQESAKTEALKYFRGTPTLRYLSDLTSRGLTPYKNEIQAMKLRHVVLLDLVRILSHGRGVSERTIQTLASLMEEGESETADAGGNERWNGFPKIGALMGITPQFFKSKRGRWRSTGFLSRFVPVCFSYSASTVRRIHDSIADGSSLPDPHPLTLPEGQIVVSMREEFSTLIKEKARTLGQEMKTYGFRYHRIMRALVKAQALVSGHGSVKLEDTKKVLEWSEFFTDTEVVL